MEGQKPAERLRCVVERITFQSEGYSVLKCRAKGYSDLVTIVGMMPDAHVGSVLTLGGWWKIDAKYGRQFQVLTFEETLPATVYGMEKYLGSGLIKGIGPKYARLIVRQFGENTLEVIETDPDRLLEVPGIGNKRVESIRKSWLEQKEIKNIMLFLQGHDVSTAHATRIYKQYGADSIQTVRENPYRLADDIWGIGFKTADTIAAKLGFEKDSPVRLRSGILYTLNRLAEEGHCYALREQLLETGSKLLEVDPETLSAALSGMDRGEDVMLSAIPDSEDIAIYLPPFYFAELGVRNRLLKIAKAPAEKPIQEQMPISGEIEYDEVQLRAIQTARESKVMVLTGGPGTGKSTTTLGIIRALAGLKILLAAPTGRAAKRLSEVTGMEAKTIHRLLEFKPPEGYKRKEDYPLEGDALIVDECSMVDVLLMNSLLKAVPEGMRLILVGDVDQLPSVGAGNVLRDVIDSGVFPVVRLTKIFRQAASSRIITNAHRINQGMFPELAPGKETDFYFKTMEDPEKAAALIVDLVAKRMPGFYHVSPQTVQVLTPMQRGQVGAANLNQLLQAAVNPAKADHSGNMPPELRRGGFTFRAGDKVMQIRNNYDKEVFNGDIGQVESVNAEEKTLVIRFDDRAVDYDVSELDEVVLAYATTVHKAQGAEFPIVVMPVMMTHYTMLQRNLLYTGVTRAKKVLVLVGERKAVSCCVNRVTADRRNTLLSERLSGKTDGLPEPRLPGTGSGLNASTGQEAPGFQSPAGETGNLTGTKAERTAGGKGNMPSGREQRVFSAAPTLAFSKERYICFDVETPNWRNNRISAIGVSVVEGGRITRNFFSYVNPEQPFDSFNTDLTGISAVTVAEAPTFDRLWPLLEPLMSSGVLVAHNAPFDLGVLKKCLRDYQIPWKNSVPYACTVQIGRSALPGRGHKLNEMCAYYRIELDHHQADSDSRACAEILIRYLLQEVKMSDWIRQWRME